jgi:hypothetical protein
VRIFLGTEEAQQRAERVFLYTVHKYRDPAREYQVYLMKDLPGFNRRAWRTGFTQYRFAIPELAGGHGCAIYNDVDQIYLADPATLFDCEMEGYGYRAVVANDTSVMVMDCARMLRWWNVRAAQTSGKRDLIEAPAVEPGLWWALDGGWNARDFEYRPGIEALHYTTLHLQPWRPPGPVLLPRASLGALWLRPSEADAQRYQPFTRERPSSLSAAARRAAAPLLRVAGRIGGCHQKPRTPAVAGQGMVSRGALRRRPARCGCASTCGSAHPRPSSPPRLSTAAQWWRECLAEAAERRPGVGWELELIEHGVSRHFEYRPPRSTPRVWVLLGKREGNNRQLLALAEALGWPFETRRLAFKSRLLLPIWLQGASLARLDRQEFGCA